MISLLIDANLLILFVVGSTSPEYIGKHKRLRAFSKDDYDLLVNIIEQVSKIILTPNTVTEASNLLKRIEEPAREKVYTMFKAIIENCEEQYVGSQKGCKQSGFIRIGITDAILLTFSDPTITLITTDLDLYLAASKRGNNVINFNHHRMEIMGI